MRICLGALLGGAIGFAFFFFARCVSGTCPIIGSPLVSTVLFAIAGSGIAALTYGKK